MTVQGGPPSPSLLAGGRYRLLERLGEGAVGVVYRALHTGIERQVALKVLHADLALDAGALERFEREARALGRLEHPNVVDVTDFGVEDGAEGRHAFLAMELLDGETLADLSRREGPLPLERALPLLDGIARALDAVHAAGIVHRDLTPRNVVLAPGPAGETVVKVLDFGLAGFLEGRPPALSEPAARGLPEAADVTDFHLGTPLYTAPEFLRGGNKASPASDLYSFAVIAYELLLGRPPFAGSPRDVLLGHLEGLPPRPSSLGIDLPPEAWEVVAAGLSKAPESRPASAGRLVAGLRAAAHNLAIGRWQADFLPRRRRWAIALALVLGVGAALLWRGGIPPLERRLYDLRLATVPRTAPDPRILLVDLDEASGQRLRGEDGNPIPLADSRWADELAVRLEAAFAAGARAAAVDLVLPVNWSASPAFSRLVLRHADRLALTAHSGPAGVTGQEAIAGLTAAALGDRAPSLFGYDGIERDPDGVTRRGRLAFATEGGGTAPSWAVRAASRLGTLPSVPSRGRFLLDARIDGGRYPRIAWADLAVRLASQPDRFRGRLLVVGSDRVESGADVHSILGPDGRPQVVAGFLLQALLTDSILRGLPLRELPPLPFVAVAWAVAGAVLALGLERRHRRLATLSLLGLGAGYATAAFALFRWGSWVIPLSGPLALLALAGALGAAARPLLPLPPPPPEIRR
jgi:CHASE2 domain-containing sensor protein